MYFIQCASEINYILYRAYTVNFYQTNIAVPKAVEMLTEGGVFCCHVFDHC